MKRKKINCFTIFSIGLRLLQLVQYLQELVSVREVKVAGEENMDY